MGVCLTPIFDERYPKQRSFSKFIDGKDLALFMDLLDDVCAQNGLTPLSTFAPDYDALAGEVPEGQTVGEVWFASADGLRTVSGLVKALQWDKRWAQGLRKSEE